MEKIVLISQRRAILDFTIGLIGRLLDADDAYKHKVWIPGTGGRFLLTGKEAENQCGHNDFRHNQGTATGYFMIVIGPEGGSILISRVPTSIFTTTRAGCVSFKSLYRCKK